MEWSDDNYLYLLICRNWREKGNLISCKLSNWDSKSWYLLKGRSTLFITFYSKEELHNEQYTAIETPMESIAFLWLAGLPECSQSLSSFGECISAPATHRMMIREAKAKHKQTVESGGVWRVRTLSHSFLPMFFFKNHGWMLANKASFSPDSGFDRFWWRGSKGLYRKLVENLVSDHCFK